MPMTIAANIAVKARIAIRVSRVKVISVLTGSTLL